MKKKKKVEVLVDPEVAKECEKFANDLVKSVFPDDDWFYEPLDYDEGDIGSATIAEMRRQNGDY